MSLRQHIITGKVSKDDFEKWKNNDPTSLMLYHDMNNVEFITKEEALKRAAESGFTLEDYNDELDMLHDFGAYYNSDDFYNNEYVYDSCGKYSYEDIDDKTAVLIITEFI